MLPIDMSAIVRALRTGLQLLVGWLLANGAEWIAGWDLSDEWKSVLSGLLAIVLSWVQRRWLDPSRIPSLVDRHALNGIDPPADVHMTPKS